MLIDKGTNINPDWSNSIAVSTGNGIWSNIDVAELSVYAETTMDRNQKQVFIIYLKKGVDEIINFTIESISNQPTWTNDIAGILLAINTINKWKVDSLYFNNANLDVLLSTRNAETTQLLIKTLIDSINTKLPSSLTVTDTRLLVDGSGVTQPVSISGTVPVTGPLTDIQLRASPVPVSLTSITVTNTVAVSAVALPLPAGASTEATLATRLSKTDFEGRINTLGQKTSANSTPVVLSSDQSTLPVSVVTLPLPTGAASSSNQTTLGSQTTKINDGTNTAAVKAASTAPVATDPALVVTISPNSPAASIAFPTGISTEAEQKRFVDFGTALNIGKNVNDYFEIDNSRGMSSIGVTVVPPTGGIVEFRGSYDGVNFFAITLRSTGSDGYTKIADNSTDTHYVGSISSLRKIRFVTTTAGSVNGSANGRLTDQTNTLEGIEHGNAPHNIGYEIKRAPFEYTVAQTNVVIVTPTAGKKWVLTQIIFSSDGTNTFTFFDETNVTANHILKGKSGNERFFDPIFPQGVISAANGNNLKLTTTGASDVRGIVFYYEI